MSAALEPDSPSVGNGNGNAIHVDEINLSPSHANARGSDADSPTVLRRLSTLFTSDAAAERTDPGASGFSTLSGMQGTEPAPPPSQPSQQQRKAIKVLVVTWNMGDALPKGDLSVLLGAVPKYEPAPGEGLPEFDMAQKHPYHVVVVAAQECPAPSGMPRGLGGTLMKGVGLQKSDAHRRDKEDKGDKEKESGKEKKKHASKEEKRAARAARKADKEGGASEQVGSSTDGSEAEDYVAPPVVSNKPHPRVVTDSSTVKQDHLPTSTATAHTDAVAAAQNGTAVRKGENGVASSYGTSSPSMMSPVESGSYRKPHSLNGAAAPLTSLKVGPRGWSAMLDDWLCNGHAEGRKRGNTMSTLLHVEITHTHDSGSNAPTRTASPVTEQPPTLPPTPSISIPASSPLSIPSPTGLQPPATTPHGRSPLAQSYESSNAGSLHPRSHEAPSLTRSPSERIIARPLVDDYRPTREPGTGMYINVAKERLLGLYTSVFVYRGCEHLVHGVDKDFVTAGLAGGRFGNKGGIGISLNLAGHRMLFVNAHLAAHTERQDARLANIAKIKQELNLDCFLPPDDPRASLEDITDRFDSTFWCGDLNFRVDISILHAKWLLEQKKYQDALMFDQLRKAMKDPKTNPLPGFHEADITFMPTFKYDVWKSVRATNRELRRSIRQRRKTLERQDRPSLEDKGSPANGLDFVPEVDGVEEQPEEESSEPPDSPETRLKPMQLGSPALPEVPLEDWRSDVSSFPGGLGRSAMDGEGGRSVAGDGERSTRSVLPTPSVPQSPSLPQSPSMAGSMFDWPRASRDTTRPSMESTHPRPTQSLKSKTKKLMGILSLGRRPRELATKTDDFSSRRQSISSMRSVATHSTAVSDEEASSPPTPIAVPGQSGRTDRVEYTPSSLMSDSNGLRRGSVSSHRTVSPSMRARPVMRRSPSGQSLREEDLDDDFDDTVDNRVGVYDTSKKARVPSWCDRVLWKTHIIPDEDEEPPPHDDVEPRAPPFSRLSLALSNFGGHFRRRSATSLDPLPQSTEVLTAEPGSLSNSTSMPVGLHEATLADGTKLGRYTSEPTETHQSGTEELIAPDEHVPNSAPLTGESSLSTPKRSRQRSITFHGGLDDSSPESVRQRRDRRATFVEGSPSKRDSLRLSLGRSGSLRRSSADPVNTPSPTSSPLALKPIKTTGHSIGEGRRRRVSSIGAANAPPAAPSSDANTFGSAIGRFFRDLPARFHSRASLFHADEDEPPHGEQARRRLAGEVEVLHYGTIDDAGMRQLEGRSDHRPAIFAAGVYVNA